MTRLLIGDTGLQKNTVKEVPLGWNVISWEKLKTPPAWFASTIYVFGVVFCVALLSLIILPTLWGLGQLVTFGEPTADDLRASLLSVGGIIATPFVIWRIWTSHTASLAALKQAEVSNQSLAYVTFSKSIEQLGSIRDVTTKDTKYSEPNFEARIGAIFSLSELAKHQQQFLSPTIETLAAYIRFHSPKSVPIDDSLVVNKKMSFHLYLSEEPQALSFDKWIEQQKNVRFDSALALHTLLDLIANIDLKKHINLTEVCLRKIELETKSICHVTFDGSQLEQLHARDLIVEDCQFRKVSARSIHAMFANVSNSYFYGCLFAHAGFDYSIFKDCRVIACDFRNASLAHVKFENSLIEGCKFDGSYITGVGFEGAELSLINFGGSILKDVSFRFADLDNIQFHRELSPYEAELLRKPEIEKATLENTNFENAWLINVDLSYVENLHQSVVDKIFFADSDVILPLYLERPTHWIAVPKNEEGYKKAYDNLREKWIELRRKITAQSLTPRQEFLELISEKTVD